MGMKPKKQMVFIIILIGFSLSLMAVSKMAENNKKPVPGEKTGQTETIISQSSGGISVTGNLTHNKVLTGGDGLIHLALTLKDETENNADRKSACDVVVVLDTSGSMSGNKMSYARSAINLLTDQLSSSDRISIVGYSDHAVKYSDLKPVTDQEKNHVMSLTHSLSPGGATNISDGLLMGIDILKRASLNKNIKRVILISDGLANRGVTHESLLGDLVREASEYHVSVSSIGVGDDFNERLMTLIADNGSGNYYYLDRLDAFAEIFLKELNFMRHIAVSDIKIEIPLNRGVALVSASGYPVYNNERGAYFFPGALLGGQQRKLFLTFKIPTNIEDDYLLSNISVLYNRNDVDERLNLTGNFHITCVEDRHEYIDSFDRSEWENMVVQEEYGKLKDDVAGFIQKGEKDKALVRIEEYKNQQRELNDVIQSDVVEQNITQGLDSLNQIVTESFTGSTGDIQVKLKKNSKMIQYDSYKERRKY